MHRYSYLTLFLLTSALLQAEPIFKPMEDFAGVCKTERSLMLQTSPDYDEQYNKLFACLQSMTALPIMEGSKAMHPSRHFTNTDFIGHIQFSPEYITEYLLGNIPDPFTHSFPYDIGVPEDVREASKQSRALVTSADSIILYTNALTTNSLPVEFAYKVGNGQQDLLIIGENNTPLHVTVTSPDGTQELRTNNKGTIFHSFNLQDITTYAIVKVKVQTQATQPTSFLIAVH